MFFIDLSNHVVCLRPPLGNEMSPDVWRHCLTDVFHTTNMRRQIEWKTAADSNIHRVIIRCKYTHIHSSVSHHKTQFYWLFFSLFIIPDGRSVVQMQWLMNVPVLKAQARHYFYIMLSSLIDFSLMLLFIVSAFNLPIHYTSHSTFFSAILKKPL